VNPTRRFFAEHREDRLDVIARAGQQVVVEDVQPS
jgi:hypothetical protein